MGLKFAWITKTYKALSIALAFILSVSKVSRKQLDSLPKPTVKNNCNIILVFLGFTLFDIIFKIDLIPKGASFDAETLSFRRPCLVWSEILFRGYSYGFWKKLSSSMEFQRKLLESLAGALLL